MFRCPRYSGCSIRTSIMVVSIFYKYHRCPRYSGCSSCTLMPFFPKLQRSDIFVENPTPRIQQRCRAPKYNPINNKSNVSVPPILGMFHLHLDNGCCIDFLQIESVLCTLIPFFPKLLRSDIFVATE